LSRSKSGSENIMRCLCGSPSLARRIDSLSRSRRLRSSLRSSLSCCDVVDVGTAEWADECSPIPLRIFSASSSSLFSFNTFCAWQQSKRPNCRCSAGVDVIKHVRTRIEKRQSSIELLYTINHFSFSFHFVKNVTKPDINFLKTTFANVEQTMSQCMRLTDGQTDRRTDGQNSHR